MKGISRPWVLTVLLVAVLAHFPGSAQIPGWAPEHEWPPMPPALTFSPPADAVQSRLQDLQAFRPFLYLNRAYTFAGRSLAEVLLQDLETRIGEVSDLEFTVELHRIAALADNAHSNIREGAFSRRFGALPLRGAWFADGFFVLRSTPEWRDLLGARLTHIDGKPIEDALALLETLVGGPEVYLRSVHSDLMLLTPALMNQLGVAVHTDRLVLRLAKPGATAFERTVGALPVSVDAPHEKSWVNQIPSAGAGNEWVSLLSDREAPSYLRDWAAPFRFEWLDNDRVPYIQIRANRDSGQRSITDFVSGVTAQLQTRSSDILVIDLRLDYGGDFTKTSDFFLSVRDLLAKDARIYVLIGNVTFSAGILGAAYLEHGAPEQVVLVGEPVGDRERFWSEAPGYKLPNSGLRIKYALQLHDVEEGCREPSICFPAELASAVAVGALVPDLPVPRTFADYESGRDAALEWILEAR